MPLISGSVLVVGVVAEGGVEEVVGVAGGEGTRNLQ